MPNCVSKTFRLPDEVATMNTYIETIDDTKLLDIVISPQDVSGKMYAFVVTKV